MKISGAAITLLSFVILSNGQSSTFLLEAECGTFKAASQDRILYGQNANILQHPWMAHMTTNKKCDENPVQDCVSHCGGTLITNNFVLSAAHCEVYIHWTTVTLGSSGPSAYAINLHIAQIITHPDYYYAAYPKNDIALFRLTSTVQYSDFIKPICLTNYRDLLYIQSPVVAAGWGKTEYGFVSRVLKKAQLVLYDQRECNKQFGPLSSSQICAGSSSSDTCHGDSGGPLTGFYYLDGMYRVAQLGIVSFGDNYCNGIGVYTNVMHYFDWIADHVLWHESLTTPAPTRRPLTKRPNFYYG